jgi:DNA-binding HxlR family transcriptional regulator
MSGYQQFCPVSKAMEVLDQRWTMLVVRELLSGTAHFNQMRRGLPTMSPTLLSKRLQELERAGLVRRRQGDREVEYRLTAAGEELRPIVEALGAWAVRWVGELGDADLDPKLLMWDWHRIVDRSTVPGTRTVVCFEFPDQPPRQRFWWMILGPVDVDVCDFDPGHGVAVSVAGRLRDLVEVWRGDRSWAQVLRSGAVTLTGPAEFRRAVPVWFRPSKFAAVPRPQVGVPG